MKFRAFAAAFVVLGGSFAAAAVTALPSTLDQLINLGNTGVTIGDKTFYDFTYLSTSVPAASVNVVQAPGSNIGLEFQFSWSASAGNSEDSTIRYKVHVNDTTPTQQLITGVGLSFNGTTSSNNTDLGTNANVVETIDDLSGNPLGQISVVNFGPNNSSFNHNSNTFTLTTPTRDLLLVKDIMVHSTTNNGAGTATVSTVDNSFQQTTTTTTVPLPPAALTGFGTIALGIATFGRGRFRRWL